MWGKFLVLVCVAVPAWAVPPVNQVMFVKDGDTLVIADGKGGEQDVRLVGINTPEGPHDGSVAEPFADEARTRLRTLALDKNIRLKEAPKPRDKYGRILADAYLPDGTWLNGQMVKEGLAHVYTFADDNLNAAPLLKLEQDARAAGKGLWSHPRWQVKDATTCCAADYIGIFQVVEGKVVSTGQGKKVVYLNFGPDYRTDFTISIDKRDLKNFKKAGIDPLALSGHTVRVHGFTDPINGVEVRVNHPAQLEILDGRR